MLESLFGVDTKQLQEVNISHIVNWTTLAFALIDKGVLTEEEFENARVKATHFVDQVWAEKRAEAEREFDEKYPNMRKVLGWGLTGEKP